MELSVEVKPAFTLPEGWDENKDGKVDVGNSGLLSNYTKEMRLLAPCWRKSATCATLE